MSIPDNIFVPSLDMTTPEFYRTERVFKHIAGIDGQISPSYICQNHIIYHDKQKNKRAWLEHIDGEPEYDNF